MSTTCKILIINEIRIVMVVVVVYHLDHGRAEHSSVTAVPAG